MSRAASMVVSKIVGRKTTRQRLEAFLAKHGTDDEVLDVGCGPGPYGSYFPNRISVDFARDGNANVQIVADAQDLPFRTESVGFVLSTELLEHTLAPDAVVSEFRRVLRKGGKALLTTRFIFPVHDAPRDYYRFTHHSLKYLFREWTRVEIVADSPPFETIGTLLQRLVFQSRIRGGRFSKGLLMLLARALRMVDRLVVSQYGDIGRTPLEDTIMASGYFVVA